MANAYVFPGGKVDPDDSLPELFPLCGLSPAQAAGTLGDVPAEVALGYYLAAIRETFEEAGVLLATRFSGEPLSLHDENDLNRYDNHRSRIHGGTLSMVELAQEEQIRFGLEQLFYWDHWVTPEVEERRFSARFFLAEMPDGFAPVHDSQETTDSGWFSPSAILERYEADRLTLAPPTLRILIEMQELGSFEAVMKEARNRIIHQPNLPIAHREDSTFYLLLPGDKDYPGATTEALHRAKMDQGRWHLIRS